MMVTTRKVRVWFCRIAQPGREFSLQVYGDARIVTHLMCGYEADLRENPELMAAVGRILKREDEALRRLEG